MIMTPEEFKKQMEAIGDKNPEYDHISADNLLCEMLRQLGYGEGVDVFENMDKWYE